MKLTLEHIAPYLPYKLNISTPNHVGKLCGIDTLNNNISIQDISGVVIIHKLNSCLPILRPLSQLTEQIEIQRETYSEIFIPVGRLIKDADKYDVITDVSEHDFGLWFELKDGKGIVNWDMTYKTVKDLLSWHFDIFGLIEKNMAISMPAQQN